MDRYDCDSNITRVVLSSRAPSALPSPLVRHALALLAFGSLTLSFTHIIAASYYLTNAQMLPTFCIIA